MNRFIPGIWLTQALEKLVAEKRIAAKLIAANFLALKGHDFSRAEVQPKSTRALAPEGCFRASLTNFKPFLAALPALCLPALLSTAALVAQQPAPNPAAPAPAPALTASGHPMNDYWIAHDKQMLNDFAWLAHFKEANLALAPPAANENRVVFMGDSITQGWKIEGPDGSFPGKPYINRGISGQTTPQMLVRFRQDVIDLKPKVVVILAGINDIAGNTGPMTLEQTEGNLASMAELAAANHIRVVMCSILPAYDFPWSPGMVPAPKVLEVNAWMKAYAAQKGHVYVDYHTAMKDERDGLPATLSHDGVHPLPAGYAVMAPLVEAGITKALK